MKPARIIVVACIACAGAVLLTAIHGCKADKRPHAQAKHVSVTRPLPGTKLAHAPRSTVAKRPGHLEPLAGPNDGDVVIYSATTMSGLVFDAECVTGTPGGKLSGSLVFPETAGSTNLVPALPNESSSLLFFMGGGVCKADISGISDRLSSGFRFETVFDPFVDAPSHFALAALTDAKDDAIVALFSSPCKGGIVGQRRLQLLVHDKNDRNWLCMGPIVTTSLEARVVVELDAMGIRIAANKDVVTFPQVVDTAEITTCNIGGIKKGALFGGWCGPMRYFAMQSLSDNSFLAKWDFRIFRSKDLGRDAAPVVVPDDSGHNCTLQVLGAAMFVPGLP